MRTPRLGEREALHWVGAANIGAGDDEIVVPELRVGDQVARNVEADPDQALPLIRLFP